MPKFDARLLVFLAFVIASIIVFFLGEPPVRPNTALAASPGADGYTRPNLGFGHGTWRNNFSVTHSLTIFYYSQVL